MVAGLREPVPRRGESRRAGQRPPADAGRGPGIPSRAAPPGGPVVPLRGQRPHRPPAREGPPGPPPLPPRGRIPPGADGEAGGHRPGARRLPGERIFGPRSSARATPAGPWWTCWRCAGSAPASVSCSPIPGLTPPRTRSTRCSRPCSSGRGGTVSGWGGTLRFVYLPAGEPRWHVARAAEAAVDAGVRGRTLALVRGLSIPVIDVEAVFAARPDAAGPVRLPRVPLHGGRLSRGRGRGPVRPSRHRRPMTRERVTVAAASAAGPLPDPLPRRHADLPLRHREQRRLLRPGRAGPGRRGKEGGRATGTPPVRAKLLRS